MTLRKRNVKIGNQSMYVIIAVCCDLERYLCKIRDQVNAFLEDSTASLVGLQHAL